MTAVSSTKSLKACVASALILGALATTPAHAQFGTFANYPTVAPSAQTITSPSGDTQTLSVFSTAITTAYGAGTGGDVTFDDATGTASPTMTMTYGTGKTLTVTDVNPAGVAGTFGPGVDAADATSGSNYLGFAGATATPYNFNFSFSQNLSNVGIMVINRAAARNLTFTVTLDNGTVVTPNAAPVATSNGGPTFFEYASTAGRSISAITFTTTDGYARFDDLGFVAAAAPAATPEPSQFAGLGLGVLGLGLLALKARKRTALGN